MDLLDVVYEMHAHTNTVDTIKQLKYFMVKIEEGDSDRNDKLLRSVRNE